MWPGRERDEAVEVMRYEALLNIAFADVPVRSIRCYDMNLRPEELVCARRTHPRIAVGGTEGWENPEYADPSSRSLLEQLLSPPPEPLEEITVDRDLQRVRRRIAESSATAPLAPSRRADFILAVNEALINALEYGAPPRHLRLWRSRAAVVGELSGQGRIQDPLVGNRRPEPGAARGHGLWIVNQTVISSSCAAPGARTTVPVYVRYV
jgi:hypothetical protein